MNEGEVFARLADIETVAPAETAVWPWVLAAAVLAFAALVYALRRRRAANTPRHTALRQIAAAERAWREGELDAKTAAYRLTTALRLGLALPQLAPEHPPGGADPRAWREWLDTLAAARYRPGADTLPDRCFAQARHWLGSAKRS